MACFQRSSSMLFQSTPPARGATSDQVTVFAGVRFQSTPPARGATWNLTSEPKTQTFQSTPPARGATFTFIFWSSRSRFQSTPPARGATLAAAYAAIVAFVSIHAPRAGGDAGSGSACASPASFNPRPPRGGRPDLLEIGLNYYLFQSTPPARGATFHSQTSLPGWECFNPRPPRGGRPGKRQAVYNVWLCFNPRPPRGGRPRRAICQSPLPWVSIHAPRAGGDHTELVRFIKEGMFQSTPPARGATRARHIRTELSERFQSTPPARGATDGVAELAINCLVSIHAPRAGGDTQPCLAHHGIGVSIHAPRAGGDACGKQRGPDMGCFNPRPPRGGRRRPFFVLLIYPQFQSTPPARGATINTLEIRLLNMVSIHAPRAGGDGNPGASACAVEEFQSTPPARGATGIREHPRVRLKSFNPRPPRGGRHPRHEILYHPRAVSIHAPRAGGD